MLSTQLKNNRIGQTERTVGVSRARKILGEIALNLSDDQIIEILHTLRLLAREHLMYNGSKERVKENASR